ncbi:hypothetical protein QAD02_013147 [Eretmocerus hayati]|uniref:Uncharacterized protein n=1 Tax=Eretmocerus hayati TaxID=131215 RepID=A0ACC2P1T6_9HYME|nr:hypothetical protein QAD02_013147 [Eretmocerus hayati]
MSCSEKPNLRVLELLSNCDDSENQDFVKFIIAPTTWINFDQERKKLIVKYLFPPYEEGENEEELFKGIFKSRAPAPDCWPSFTVAKELGETSTLKGAEQILKEYTKKEKNDEMDEKLKALENTSLDPSSIPSLTQPPSLFAQDTMKGTEICGSFLAPIENGVGPVHHSPTKIVETKCSGIENGAKKRKTRGKQSAGNLKKPSPKKQKTKNRKKNVEQSEKLEQASRESIILSDIDDEDLDISNLSKDVSLSLTEDLTPLNISSSSQNVENCSEPATRIVPAQPNISDADNLKITEDTSNMIPNNALSTSSSDMVEITPIHMNQLAIKKDIEDLKSYHSRRFNSLSQQLSANSNALTEVKNLLKSRETPANGRTVIFLDDVKAQHNLLLPIPTFAEFITFDEKLSGLALKQDLATYFGGMITPLNNGRNSIREILKAFFRKAVLKDNYVALQVPDENVRARLQLDDSLIRDSFSKVVMGVKDWEGGRAERSQKTGDSQDEE